MQGLCVHVGKLEDRRLIHLVNGEHEQEARWESTEKAADLRGIGEVKVDHIGVLLLLQLDELSLVPANKNKKEKKKEQTERRVSRESER